MLTDCCFAGKKVLVTGGAGFLGRHLLPRLLEAGAEITCIARSHQAAASLPAGVRIARGDCSNPGDMRKAIAGCELVVHMAASLFGTSWNDYLASNSGMAQALASAVAESGTVGRVILISSMAAAGPSAAPPGRSEQESAAPVSAYGWSKLMAERTLAARLPAGGPDLVILRPPIIYGSGDRGLLPMFRCCSAGFGISPGIGSFPVSAIHASDAARAIMFAALPQACGIYHLSDGEEYEMADFCRAMGAALGRPKTIVLRLPLALMGLSAWLGAGVSAFAAKSGIGKHNGGTRAPSWNPDKYREASQPGWLADSGRITKELGFSAEMDLRRGMAEAVEGYRQAGML